MLMALALSIRSFLTESPIWMPCFSETRRTDSAHFVCSQEIASYFRNVHRSFTVNTSELGIRFSSWGSRISFCQPRFHTMNRSLPGRIVQRMRVFVPTFCDSVSYCTKLDSTRLGFQ